MAGGSKVKKKRGRPKRGLSSSEAPRKVKSMVELIGVEPVLFSEDEEPILNEDGSGIANETEVLSPSEMQRKTQIRVQFSHLLEKREAQRSGKDLVIPNSPSNPGSSNVNIPNSLGGDASLATQMNEFVKIDMEDIVEEVNYWSPSLVCYVLGANPPLPVLEGFCRRIWKNMGIDKVAGLGQGVFIVRFNTVEQRDFVLNNGIMFFDKKPLIMKPWNANDDFKKEDMQQVPIWIQLTNLDLKYWGEQSLFKIVSQIGQQLKIDPVTKSKGKLNFARIMIEVSIAQSFPSIISFINEKDCQMDVMVHYEWKPIVCSHCKGLGHESTLCKKQNGSKVWIPKDQRQVSTKQDTIDAEGFCTVKGKGRKRDGSNCHRESVAENLSNTFQVLAETNLATKDTEQGIDITAGGGDPPTVLSWNVRGLNQTQKQHEVKKFILTKKISLVGLLETKVKAKKMGALFLNMFRDWCFTSNNAWFNNGRILLAWNPNVFSVDIRVCSSQCIHCWVVPQNGSSGFFCTFVYAFNDEERRRVLWQQIRDIQTMEPWILLGDFNATINKDERIGYRVRSLYSESFCNCLLDCDLLDIPFHGCFFTWNNKQIPPGRIIAKLDRVLGNSAWLENFPLANACFLPEGIFDHSPTVVSLSKAMELGKKPFRYFKMWQKFKGYHQYVREAWCKLVQGTPMFRVVAKLKRVKIALKNLNTCIVGDISTSYFQSEQLLHQVQQQVNGDPHNPQLIADELRYRQEHNARREAYIDFLRQKENMTWLQSRDENTQVFHRRIRQRRLQNYVMAIHDEQGKWHDTPMGIQNAFLEYYQNLLGGKYQRRRKVQHCVMNEGPVLSKANIQTLL
ncbi:uncharacterized protein LOC133825461 [Humulus lupulus]|uniref:uncharacterized protein LOC133825461 n=1 Tax=Humulus lupulus TaxID=3486 RepID=UPI002B412B54|nr:uncharacterized protein LOC133825461 [Humulus lupulus]